MKPLLEINELRTWFDTPHGTVKAVDGVTLDVQPGEMVGLVGESGCGKSVTSLSIMGLLPESVGRIVSGSILFNGQDLTRKTEKTFRKIRGNRIAMIFQEPMTSLNPVFTVGFQLVEALRLHTTLGRVSRRLRAEELLEMVGIPDPHRRLEDYPHQMSGGMRQRVMIAMGLACDPDLLIADEPTTALDVTIQAQILELLADLQARMNMGVMLITHNLGVVAEMAQRLVVMYAGKIVEKAETRTLFANPCHPYTIGLLESIPQLEQRGNDYSRLATIQGMVPHPFDFPTGCRFHPRCPFAMESCSAEEIPFYPISGQHRVACRLYSGIDHPMASDLAEAYQPAQPAKVEIREPDTLLTTDKLVKTFTVRSKRGRKMAVHAVQGISLSVDTGETLGVVGESGCGKTTLGKLIVGLERPTTGDIAYRGESLIAMSAERRRAVSRDIQMVFQDPFSSLNPRMTVRDIIAEGLDIHQLAENNGEREEMIASALAESGLQPEYMNRYPHEFSGGQRQRIGIARALVMSPRLIICDEPVSALDVSIQAQIINLLQDLQAGRGLSYLFIAHDLSVVHHISDRVMVMYLGHVMETGPTEELFENTRHPYTQALLSAVPGLDPEGMNRRVVLSGDVPSPIDPPSGCPFQTRCPKKTDARCESLCPPLTLVSDGHYVACWRHS